MLVAIHRALQRLIYERGQIDERIVDVSFEMPSPERIARLTRPTVSFFLYDIQENLTLRHSNLETTRENGRAVQFMATRRFDLHYMISVFTTDIEDQHLLLWRLLTTLVNHPQFPAESLEEALRTLEPLPSGRLEQSDDLPKALRLWDSLHLPPQPAFCYVITVPVGLNAIGEAPLVLKRTARYTGMPATGDVGKG